MNKKSLRISIVMCCVLLVICFVSCTAGQAELSDVGYVRFAVETPKELDVTDSGRIDHFEYMAEPQFETTAFAVSGVTEDWTIVDGDEDSSALIGPFTQGRWKFELHAVSRNGYVMWEGKGEGYINVSTDSVIPITLTRVAGEGYIDFRITVPEYTTTIKAPTITIDNKTVSNLVWEESGRGSGKIEFHAIASGISAGWHNVIVRVGDGGTTTGEAVAVEVSAGNYTFIKGECSIGEYTNAYLKIEAPAAARSEIRNSSGKKILSDEMKYKESRTYTYALTNGKTAATVTWYVNGEEKGTGKTFTFTPQTSGIFELSALSRYYAESSVSSVWIEESTSSSITVYVEPKLSTITWNTGEIVTRQSVSYDTVLTIGAPIRDGYVFKYWKVTGSTSGTYYSGSTLTVNGTSYTFTAVWTAAPQFKLTANTTAGTLTEASGSTRKVPEEGLGVTCSKAGDYRWFVNGKEVFWILDKGDGLFEIPGKTEAGLVKGDYTVRVEGTIDVSGVKKKVVGTFTLTWE